MDHETLPCTPELGMYASDRDIFDRVWKRVMPADRPDCPIVVVPPAPYTQEVHTPAPAPEMAEVPETPAPPEVCRPPEEPEVPEEPERPAPPEVPEVPEEPEAPEMPEAPEPPESCAPTGDDFPGPEAVPCLGSGSAAHGSQLQEDIMAELEGWQLYRHLARRVTGGAGRALSALASEKHRAARRLAAAYFLISGVRYWPTDRLAVPRPSAWLGTLRRRFAAEQHTESRYRAAALDTADPCLADLYAELADGCAAHAGVLRTLLEGAL